MNKRRFLYGLCALIPVLLLAGLVIDRGYFPPILMYHALDKDLVGKYASVSPVNFSRQMAFIKNKGYNVIPLKDLCLMIKEGRRIPRDTVVITFDDGYKDNLAGVKILREYGFPATIFIVGDYIGKQKYLNEEEIRWIINNTKVSVGSHTMTHPYLPDSGGEDLPAEIRGSKKFLGEKFGREIHTMAYPIGGFDRRVLKEVEDSGYLCACSTNCGYSKKTNLFSLRRVKIKDSDLGLKLWLKLSGFYNLLRTPKNPG